MRYSHLANIGVLSCALAIGACNRDAGVSRDATVETTVGQADAAADNQRDRDDDIARLDSRVAELERDYGAANQKIADGSRTATGGLREELQEDVMNVKSAVSDLRTTTPDNWWQRHEAAMKRTADDIEADVKRLAGTVTPTKPAEIANADGEAVSTAPFTSQRDRFVAEMRARVEAMEKSLDVTKVSGPRETEVEDARARVKKLGEDVDRLRSASPDDWWDVTKARVTEYVDRVESSVDRLDDDKS